MSHPALPPNCQDSVRTHVELVPPPVLGVLLVHTLLFELDIIERKELFSLI